MLASTCLYSLYAWLYSAAAAAEVQSDGYMNAIVHYSLYYFTTFYVRQKVCAPSLTPDPGNATVDTSFVPDTYSNYDDDG